MKNQVIFGIALTYTILFINGDDTTNRKAKGFSFFPSLFGSSNNIEKHVTPYKTELKQDNDIDNLPNDLRELAESFGYTDTSKMPSLDEIGNLLGTTTKEETIDFLRDLASTEDGRSLIKSYADSYTPETTTVKITTPPDPKLYLPTSEYPGIGGAFDRAHTNIGLLNTVLTPPEPDAGFFQRLASFFRGADNTPIDLETSDNHNNNNENLIKTIPYVQASSSIPIYLSNIPSQSRQITLNRPRLPASAYPVTIFTYLPPSKQSVDFYNPEIVQSNAFPQRILLKPPSGILPYYNNVVQPEDFNQISKQIPKLPLENNKILPTSSQYINSYGNRVSYDGKNLRRMQQLPLISQQQHFTENPSKLIQPNRFVNNHENIPEFPQESIKRILVKLNNEEEILSGLLDKNKNENNKKYIKKQENDNKNNSPNILPQRHLYKSRQQITGFKDTLSPSKVDRDVFDKPIVVYPSTEPSSAT